MNQSALSRPLEKESSATALQERKKMERRRKKDQQRNPFKDLSNGGSISTKDGSFIDNNSNASTSSTSMSSIEAPKGCLRFFLSHSSSSSSTSAKTPFINNSAAHKDLKPKPFSSKTPKSAPVLRPPRENLSKKGFFEKPISQKGRKNKGNLPQSVNKLQFRRKPSSKNGPRSELSSNGSSPVIKRKSASLMVDGVSDTDAANFTPLSKLTTGCLDFTIKDKVSSDDDCGKCNTISNTKASSSDTKTPPVQASVSPEIQCGSSVKMALTTKATTPICYGAGHVLSGVTDKRKCKARGILTVGEGKALDCFDSDDNDEQDDGLELFSHNNNLSMFPLPAEASMHWLLSPCKEEDEDQKENSENRLDDFQRSEEDVILDSLASPSCGIDFSPDLCYNSSEISSRLRRRSSSVLSPSELTSCEGCLRPPLCDNWTVLSLEEERRNCNGVDTEDSPISIDSMDNKNVIQTPQSDSSSERRIAMPRLFAEGNEKKENFDSELSAVDNHLQMASLSPKSHVSIWDPRSSSFQFDCLTTPSNSVDLSVFQKILDDRASWFTNSTLETLSQSQMRISWREGLASRIFEMDEFDCCRCLSDEEDDANRSCNDDMKSSPCSELNVDMVVDSNSTNDFVSEEIVERDHATDEMAKKRFSQSPQLLFSCAESISIGGADLVRSEDSDWSICYKNHLFQV